MGPGVKDEFGKKLKVCVWVSGRVCGEKLFVLLRGVFVFVGGERERERVSVCVFVFANCGGVQERWRGCHSAIRLTGAPSSGPGSSDCRFEETK